MGHPVINTPSIDQLARQSIQFNRGYVPTALCRPSLATIITGLYPRQHGITGNDPFKQKGSTPQEYQKLRQRLIGKIDQVPTIPQLLAKVGYVSFQSGKWWEGHYSRGGFTNGMTHGDPNRGGRHGDEGLMIGRSGLRPIEQFVDGALAEEKPFFLWYAPFLPHTPHNPPKRLLNQYLNDGRPVRLAKYYAMCEWFDETCGQLLKLIDDKGLRENTMIVYVTDNGWIQRTSQSKVPEGWPASYAPRSKQSPNEGGVRTPILIRWPNHAPPVSKDDLVSSVDIAPTILNACGATVPDNLPGLDLLKLAVSNSGGNDRALFGEGYAHDIADINEPSKSLLYRWVIQDEFKLIRRYKGKLGRHAKVHESFDKTEQLFHLKSDPHETKNLVNSRTELVQKLRAQLDQDWKLSD